MYGPLDGSVYAIIILCEGHILKILHVLEIFITFELLFCGFDVHKMIFVFDLKTDRNTLNKNEINVFYSDSI